MTDPDAPTEATDEAGGVPRWVKVSGIVAAIAIAVLILIAVLTGSSGHGPARHLPQGGVSVPGSAPALGPG